MYPDELQKFIRDRNYELNKEEILKATSIEENPQLTHIKWEEPNYKMWDRYGNYYQFKVRVKKK